MSNYLKKKRQALLNSINNGQIVVIDTPTTIRINLTDSRYMQPTFYYSYEYGINAEILVDWGDGSLSTWENENLDSENYWLEKPSPYSDVGEYTITITSNGNYYLGGISNSSGLLGRNYAYYITSVTVGDKVTKLSDYVFENCWELTDITIPNSTTSIGEYAFYSCSKLTKIIIPDNVTSIGECAFNYCESLENVTIPKIARIEYGTFDSCENFTNVTIPETVVDIGDCAFRGCESLTSITIPDSVVHIGNRAFANLININDFNMDKNIKLESIGEYTFSGIGVNRTNPSDNIITMDFSNSTFTSIPQYIFGSRSSSFRASHLKIIFPSTVSILGAYAFGYTDNCDLYFNSITPPTLSVTTAWSNATNYKIFVPYSSVSAYRVATNWETQSSYIKGFSSSNSFENGATLPETTSDGYTVTWYSDANCTIQVTNVDDASAIYYCVVGT